MKFDEGLAIELFKLPIELTRGDLPEPPDAARPAPTTTPLASLNLLRGRALGLPCGADVARALGEEPLNEQQLFPDYMDVPLEGVKDALVDATPLWYYILREAALMNPDPPDGSPRLPRDSASAASAARSSPRSSSDCSRATRSPTCAPSRSGGLGCPPARLARSR